MDLNATFDIGSARKQFVAAAILLLAEDKRLALSDDVRKFFPSQVEFAIGLGFSH